MRCSSASRKTRVTLWAFLSQILATDKSCYHALSRVNAWLAAENAPVASSDTSAYCQARKRLSEKLLRRLFITVAQGLENQVKLEHLWCGRYVKVIDGTSVSMPDTLANQKAYPIAVQSVSWLWFSYCYWRNL